MEAIRYFLRDASRPSTDFPSIFVLLRTDRSLTRYYVQADLDDSVEVMQRR